MDWIHHGLEGLTVIPFFKLVITVAQLILFFLQIMTYQHLTILVLPPLKANIRTAGGTQFTSSINTRYLRTRLDWIGSIR